MRLFGLLKRWTLGTWLRRPPPRRGKLITLEGTEGGGKSTQMQLLAERLRQMGHRVRTLREPGGTPLGEEIRHILKSTKNPMAPEAELLLMNASRAQLVREVILPALQAEEIVLCDRYYHSTLVYQGFARQMPLRQVHRIIAYAIGACQPDLTLVLYVPLAVSEARRGMRQATLPGYDRFEAENRAFFQRVERGYQQLAAQNPRQVKIIDATAPIERVADQIWEVVEPLLA